MYIYQLIDWYIGVLAPLTFAFIECIVFGWIYGKDSEPNMSFIYTLNCVLSMCAIYCDNDK